jgi:hypothetical protein
MYRQLERIQKELKERVQVISEQYSLVGGLLTEVDSIISNFMITIPSYEVLLQFEDDQRTVTWNGGGVKLGHKSWLFVKSLWEGQHHTRSVEKIEQVVWDRRTRKKRLVKVGKRTIKVDTVSRNTFNSFLYRLKSELHGKFPYKIVPVKSRQTREIVGYRLTRTKQCELIFKNAQ